MREALLQRRTQAAVVGFVLALALGLRLMAVLAFVGHEPISVFFAQATELGCLADSAAAGHGLSSPFGGNTGPSAFLAPGYPLLVAAVFRGLGAYSDAAGVALMVLQAVFGTATVAVLMGIARRLAGPKSALAAGLLCAVSPPLVLLTTLFWETTLTVLLFAALVAAALGCAKRESDWRWVGFGMLAGFALMVNPALAPVVACCVGCAAWQVRPGGRLRLVGAACFACVMVCLPWVVRNERALHAFIPMRSNFGYELWQGNRVGTDGYFDQGLHPNVNAQEFARYRQLGEVSYMHEKGEMAKAAIGADRGRFMRLTVKRVVRFWAGAGRVPAGPLMGYVVVSDGFGLAGLCVLWRRSRAHAVLLILLLLLFPAPYYITHPDARFRLVFEPMMLMLGVYGVSRLVRLVRRQNESESLSEVAA